jgi:hypothetical protein
MSSPSAAPHVVEIEHVVGSKSILESKTELLCYRLGAMRIDDVSPEALTHE